MLSQSPSSGGGSFRAVFGLLAISCGATPWGLHWGGCIDSNRIFSLVFWGSGVVCCVKGENLGPADPNCVQALEGVSSPWTELGDVQTAGPPRSWAGPSLLHQGCPVPLALGAGPAGCQGFLFITRDTFLVSMKKSVDLRQKWKILSEPD